jgi:GT2 family glycosyltransferase
MLPRKLVETIGLFDENIWPAYFEDNDYHFRCILGGMGIGVWTWLAPFRHARSSTIVKYPNLIPHFAKNQQYFIAKWGGLPGDVLQKNEALKRACEDMEKKRQLEAGEGWKKAGDGEPQN